MKNKRILLILVAVVIVLGICSYVIYSKVQKNKQINEISEYTPQEEITDSQLRQTIVSLYFNSKDTNTLMPEGRAIDVKELTKEPYLTLVNLLIQGPKNEKLEKVIPDGTTVNKVEFKNGVVCIDFSKEFVENHQEGVEKESKTIYSIVNTLTQLNEVEAVKILIDGKEDGEFKDAGIKFTEAFVKKD